MWTDSYLPPLAHQLIGVCLGILLCAWFVGATSEQVALIRLPASIVVLTYMGTWALGGLWRIARGPWKSEV